VEKRNSPGDFSADHNPMQRGDSPHMSYVLTRLCLPYTAPFVPSATTVGPLSEAAVRPSVCLPVCHVPLAQNGAF